MILGEECSEEGAAGEAPSQYRQGRDKPEGHCGGTNSTEMDSAGWDTGVGDGEASLCSAATVGLVAPAVVTMEMWVLAGLGFRGQGRHRGYAPKLEGPQTTGSQKTRAQEAAWPGSLDQIWEWVTMRKETHFSSGRKGPELWLMAPVSC